MRWALGVGLTVLVLACHAHEGVEGHAPPSDGPLVASVDYEAGYSVLWSSWRLGIRRSGPGLGCADLNVRPVVDRGAPQTWVTLRRVPIGGPDLDDLERLAREVGLRAMREHYSATYQRPDGSSVISSDSETVALGVLVDGTWYTVSAYDPRAIARTPAHPDHDAMQAFLQLFCAILELVPSPNGYQTPEWYAPTGP